MDKGKKEPVILITNDDGITAPGIKNLIEAVKDLGKVVVVAPDKPQSGMGHAITIGVPLRLHKVNFFEGKLTSMGGWILAVLFYLLI